MSIKNAKQMVEMSEWYNNDHGENNEHANTSYQIEMSCPI